MRDLRSPGKIGAAIQSLRSTPEGKKATASECADAILGPFFDDPASLLPEILDPSCIDKYGRPDDVIVLTEAVAPTFGRKEE